MSKDKPLLSVQVALKPEATTEAEQVREMFADAGFEVGPLFANNFSITAAEDKFEKFFKVRVKSSSAGGVQFAKAKGEARQELNPDDLPPALRDKVEIIVASAPPDFGPFNP
jgi:hypothetical protein